MLEAAKKQEGREQMTACISFGLQRQNTNVGILRFSVGSLIFYLYYELFHATFLHDNNFTSIHNRYQTTHDSTHFLPIVEESVPPLEPLLLLNIITELSK